MQKDLLCGGHQHSESHHETIDTLYIYSARKRSEGKNEINVRIRLPGRIISL